jgi:arsenate reductase (thioredoxin)
MAYRNLLFICAGNSVRSQMAEGWARELSRGKATVDSAGIHPCGLDPLAVEVMRQAGVDISGQTSRMIDQSLLHRADCIITMCDSVQPYASLFPPTAKHLHWAVQNPDALAANGGTREDAYIRIRDKIRSLVEAFLREEGIIESSDCRT